MVCVLHKHLPNWIHEASLCVCKGQVDTGSMHALIETCGECLVLSSTQIVVTAGASSWYELKRAQWEAALHIKAHIWYPYVAET